MAVEVKYTQLFIDNQFIDSVSGKTFETVNPADGSVICEVAEANANDVDQAVSAARSAFSLGSTWRTMDASERGNLMFRLCDLIEQNREYIEQLESQDAGKPISDARDDVTFALANLRYFAGWPDKIHGKTIPIDGPYMSMTKVHPVGVVAQIIPWNYPLLMLAWKWGPALATGCTMVLKPAEQTPLSALYVASLAREAGFPPGVINVVPGFGKVAGAALSAHPDVNKVAFTGSVAVGKEVMMSAAMSNLKRVTLELGGKSPLVVFADADLDEAVETCHNAIFANQGQNCVAGSRTFVEAKIYAQFVAKATAMAASRKVGPPAAPDTQTGPLITQAQMDKVLDYIDSGKKQGARLQTGGKRVEGLKPGFFVEPTVFSDVTDDMKIAREEIFGPVQSIIKFNNMEEVIGRANATTYGLGAGIITKDIDKALTFAQAVQAGSVFVNCYDIVCSQTPFGGFKMSGQGRELGEAALHEYCEIKTITIKLPEKNS